MFIFFLQRITISLRFCPNAARCGSEEEPERPNIPPAEKNSVSASLGDDRAVEEHRPCAFQKSVEVSRRVGVSRPTRAVAAARGVLTRTRSPQSRRRRPQQRAAASVRSVNCAPNSRRAHRRRIECVKWAATHEVNIRARFSK